jgi:hypothetical protein
MTNLNWVLNDALSVLGPQAKDIVLSIIMKRYNTGREGAGVNVNDVFVALDDLFGPISEILKERISANLANSRPDAASVHDGLM